MHKICKEHAVERNHDCWKGEKGTKLLETNLDSAFCDYVKYDIDGFLDKNKDELGKNLDDVVKTSSVNLVKTHLFPPETEDSSKPAKRRFGGRRGGRNKKVTQVGTFRVQLSNLMKALNKSQPHFIRCIKPNKLKDHSIFDSGMINRQLACSGVHQAVLVRKQGYPYRLDFDFFVNRYWPSYQQQSVVSLSNTMILDQKLKRI